jgi:hypothetical protein
MPTARENSFQGRTDELRGKTVQDSERMKRVLLRTALVTMAGISLFCLDKNCSAGDPIGYAWPKNDLLITNTTPSRFKGLKNGGTYPLIVKLDSGYSIVCEGVDGQKMAALLPLNDRFGNPLAENVDDRKLTVSSRFVIMDTLDEYVRLKPGVVPMQHGKKYAVLDRSDGNLSVIFTSTELTQEVSVAEADVKFLTLTKYTKALESVIQNLKTKAEKPIESGDYDVASDIFKLYQGEFADDTIAIREKLASQYAENAEAIAQEQKWQEHLEYQKLAVEQRAKGLVLYQGQWMTSNELSQAEQREAEREQEQELARSAAEERAAEDEPLSRISAIYEWQNVWQDGGMKLVVRIRNSSRFRFSGTVDVKGKTARDETVDSDKIYLDDERGVPGNGERAAILWLKNPENITHLDFTAQGSFKR